MSTLTRLTLRKKIFLLALPGLLLGVGVFAFLSMQALNQSMDTMLQERLTTASLVADYIDEVLVRSLNELENTAHTIGTASTESELKLHIDTLNDTYSHMSITTNNIFLLDRSGKVIWSRTGNIQAMDDVSMSYYPSIEQTMKDGEASISGIVSTPIDVTPVILLASPTQEGQPAPDEILVVAIDIAQSNVGGFIQPIKLGQTGYTEIVDQNGIVVARTEPGRPLAPFEKSDHPERFAALITAGEPTVRTCHTCHESEQQVERKDVLAFTPLKEASWGVVIRQSEDEALGPTRGLRQKLFFSGGGLMAIALIVMVVTTRDVVGRIGILTTASRRIAGGDLTSPVVTSGKDEISTLATSFDDMRIKLKTSYNELEQRTRELSSLLAVSEILTSTLDLPNLLDAVVAKAIEVIPGVDGGTLIIKNTDTGDLMIQSVSGLGSVSPSPLASITDGNVMSCLISEQTDNEIRSKAEEYCNRFLQSVTIRSGVQSAICAPLVHKTHCIGILILVNLSKPKAFSDSDLRLLQTITDYIAIAIERDQLTEEAEEARALREADRLKSHFISSISHELRTPLTSIKGYSSSLLRQDVSWDEKTKQEFLQTIDGKADELRDLIDKLLQMARLEAGAQKLEKEPLLMPRLAHKVIEDIAPRAKIHKFILKFSPSFPIVEADVHCLEQVLRNLVENAIKYSPEGGNIVISGEVKKNNVVIMVGDEGLGIPPEHHSSIFDRFYRVDSPLTRGTPGSGLGLSIAKAHIETHGGEIWVDSNAGEGSRFYFTLPLDQNEDNILE